MKQYQIILSIIVAALVTNLIRVLPVTVFKKKITNRFWRSFLYYVPYVTLAVMTFPAIMEATASPLAGAIALLVGIVAAWFGIGLLPVSLVCCIVVFVTELLVL